MEPPYFLFNCSSKLILSSIFGNLEISKSSADNLASIANHKMGEGSESQPIAIIRNSQCELTSRSISQSEMAISHEQCLYIRGFTNTLN